MNNYKYIAPNFSTNEIVGLLAIALAVLWSPMSIWYLHMDGSARIPLFIFCLSFILLYKEFRKYAIKKIVSLYIFVAIYMVINGLLNDSGLTYDKDGNYLMITNILEPVLTMMITIVLAHKNFSKTLKWLAWILLAYCILCLSNSGYDDRERLNAEINANEIAINCAICFGLLLMQYIRNRGKKSWLPIVFAILPVYTIMMTGSRMSLGMIGIIVLFAWYTKFKDIPSKSIVFIIVLGLALACIGYYILGHTMIGERMMETTDTERLPISTGTLLDNYGDRGLQYYFSWPYFLENPICGIGFHKWILYSPTGNICHSEYMVQYVECGLLAFIPYMIFLFSLLRLAALKFHIRLGRDKMVTSAILTALMLAVIFSNSVLWSYNIHAVFIVYGIVFAYSNYETI